MNDQPHRKISSELRPYVDKSGVEPIDKLGERLTESRPIPRAGFRAELKAHLTELEQRQGLSWRPRNLRAAIAAYAGSGLSLLGIAALGASGAGPLG